MLLQDVILSVNSVDKGKTTWKVFEKHSALLNDLGHGTLSESTIRSVEEFFCRIFSPSSNETNNNDIRYRMFQKGTKEHEKLPPTRKSLEQYINRAYYQARCGIWQMSYCPISSRQSGVDGMKRPPLGICILSSL